MITLRQVIERIFVNKQNIAKLVLGGLLTFIPIVNFLSLGYLVRFGRDVYDTGHLELPQWEDWLGLFVEGMKGFLILLVYVVFPLLLAWIISTLLAMVTGGILGWLPYFPVTLVALASPAFFLSALYSYYRSGELIELIERIPNQYKRVVKLWTAFVVPTLALLGLQIVGLSLYGFAFFIAFAVFIPYSIAVFVESETPQVQKNQEKDQ